MTALEAVSGYPPDQVFGVGVSGGWLWFGLAKDMPEALAELDEKIKAKPKLRRSRWSAEDEDKTEDYTSILLRDADAYPSLADPVIFIRISGDDGLPDDQTYFDYDDYRQRALGEKAAREEVKICAEGFKNLAGAVVKDATKEYMRDLRALNSALSARQAKIREAQSLYMYSVITSRPPYFCGAAQRRYERARKGTQRERELACKVDAGEQWFRSQDFTFYCNEDADDVIRMARRKAGL